MTTHLIISRNQRSHGFQNTHPCEFAWSDYRLEVQTLLTLLLRHPALLFCPFLFLHGFPNGPRNCPVVDWYVRGFTLIIVDLVMLADMKAARRVSSLVEGPSLPMQFRELFAIPASR
jgi:hypothetical protein